MRRIAALGAALLVIAAADSACALSPSPLALEIAPSAIVAGERTTLRITATGDLDSRVSAERVDVYVVSVFVPGGLFLTPAGTWSAEPIPLRTRTALGAATPLVVEWPRAAPVGWTLLAVVVVRESADPLARGDWLFRPAEAWIRIDHPMRTLDGRNLATLIGLAALTVAGVFVVIRYPRDAAQLPGAR